MLFLDTSALVASLSEAATHWDIYETLVRRREKCMISTLTLYEWQRGPRTPAEMELRRILLPDEAAAPFGWREAALSAVYYRTLPRARARVMDFAIAACAVSYDAPLWTLNRADFRDIPGLRLVEF